MSSGGVKLPGVDGHPIGHRLSPRMHSATRAADGKLVRESEGWIYVPTDVRQEPLSEAARRLAVLGFAGFEVTVQYNQAMLALVDELDEAVNLASTVNTVVVGEGRLRDMSKDGSDFVEVMSDARA